MTGVLSVAREPVRLTLRVWEFGLSTAAEAARIGSELLERSRSFDDGVTEYRAGPHPAYDEDGGAPDVPPDASAAGTAAPGVEDGAPAEPEAVTPETGYLAPEPGEVGPEPDVLDVEDAPPARASSSAGTADAPPAVPDELVPDHVDEEPVLVAEVAEGGAEEGAGPELSVEPPWDGYDQMTATDITDRLTAASPAEAAAVELYESTKKGRSSVLEAAARALKA